MTLKDVKWNVLIPYVVVAAVCLAVGWFLKPSKTETHESTKTVETVKTDVILKQLQQLQDQISKVMDEQKNMKLHIETVVTTNKDGSSVKKVTEDKNVSDVVHTQESETKLQAVTLEKQVVVVQHDVQTIDKTVKLTLPVWQLGARAGLNLMPKLGLTPTFGLEGGHRFIGPLWLGGYVDTVPNFTGVQLGVRAWLEFQ